eukprot:1363357-Alexandrium_andersonii.AAC.1
MDEVIAMPAALQVAVPAPVAEQAAPQQPQIAEEPAGRHAPADTAPPPPPPAVQTAPPPPPLNEHPGPARDDMRAAGHSVTSTGVVVRGPQAYAGLLPPYTVSDPNAAQPYP